VRTQSYKDFYHSIMTHSVIKDFLIWNKLALTLYYTSSTNTSTSTITSTSTNTNNTNNNTSTKNNISTSISVSYSYVYAILRNAKTKDFWSGMKIKVLSSLDLGYAT
jgi:maltose-binding protein MalE